MPEWLLSEFNRLPLNDARKNFLLQDLPLLGLIKKFFTVEQAWQMPDEEAESELRNRFNQFARTPRPVSPHLERFFEKAWCLRMLAEKTITLENCTTMATSWTIVLMNSENGFIALKENLISVAELVEYTEDNVTDLKIVLSDYGVESKRRGKFDLKEARTLVYCNMPK